MTDDTKPPAFMPTHRSGVDVYRERFDQAQQPGNAPEDDDRRIEAELIFTAIAYLLPSTGADMSSAYRAIKFTPNRKRLVHAAALIIREIERIDRAEDVHG